MTAVDWGGLQDAYGSAEQVPALVDKASGSGTAFGEAWDELWSRLCHQGTVYSASYAAIPLLADACRRQPVSGYMAGLQLVGSIVASTDGPEPSTTVRSRYSREIADLRGIAEQTLSVATSDAEFLYAVETLMAFEDGGRWQRDLNYVANGEVPLDCPTCAEHLLLHLEVEPPWLSAWDTEAGGVPVESRAPEPGTVEARIIDLATENGRHDVARTLGYVFGTTTCPFCGSAFEVAAAIV